MWTCLLISTTSQSSTYFVLDLIHFQKVQGLKPASFNWKHNTIKHYFLTDRASPWQQWALIGSTIRLSIISWLVGRHHGNSDASSHDNIPTHTQVTISFFQSHAMLNFCSIQGDCPPNFKMLIFSHLIFKILIFFFNIGFLSTQFLKCRYF